MSKLRIICDLDGIVYHFRAGFQAVYNDHAQAPIDLDSHDEWDMSGLLTDARATRAAFDACDTEGFWMGLPVLGDAVIPTLERWNEQHDLLIVTSPWGPASCAAKWKRVLSDMAFLQERQVCLFKDKHRIPADVIIDDRPQTLEAFAVHQPECARGTVRWPAHRDHLLEGVFLADSWADPTSAWVQLAEWVATMEGSP